MVTRAEAWCVAMVLGSVGCGAGGLDETGTQASDLACHATVGGEFQAMLGAEQGPSAGAFLSQGTHPISLNCGTDNHGPLLALAVPKAAGPFTTLATFETHPYSNACTGESDGTCNDWYSGSCSGVVGAGATQVGDRLRGSFACASLTGIVHTSATRSVHISDGTFDLQLVLAPPE